MSDRVCTVADWNQRWIVDTQFPNNTGLRSGQTIVSWYTATGQLRKQNWAEINLMSVSNLIRWLLVDLYPPMVQACCSWQTPQPSGFYSLGRKEMFYLTSHSTHFNMALYGIEHMVKNNSYSERRNPLPPLHGMFYPISSKGSFYMHIPQTG